jgi:hypothetical protein
MLGAFGWSEPLDAMVAAGTLALAFVAWRTLQFAARQIDLDERRQAAAQRPIVSPASPIEWVDRRGQYAEEWMHVLPIENVSPGPAFGIEGRLHLRGTRPGVYVPIMPVASVAPGVGTDAHDWRDAVGFLRYRDVAGVEWVTEFSVVTGNDRWSFRVRATASLRRSATLTRSQSSSRRMAMQIAASTSGLEISDSL